MRRGVQLNEKDEQMRGKKDTLRRGTEEAMVDKQVELQAGLRRWLAGRANTGHRKNVDGRRRQLGVCA